MNVFRRDTLRSPQLKKRRRKAYSMRLAIGLVLVALLVVAASFVSKAQFLRIASVTVEGNTLVSSTDISAIVDRVAGESLWKIFSKRNAFLFPNEEIRAAILDEYPILSKADVRLDGLTAVSISVAEREPSALLCVLADAADPFTDQCYFMDAGGFVYSKAPEFKGSAYFKYYGYIEGGPVGVHFMNPEAYGRLSAFAEGMKEAGVTPLYIHVRQDGDVESYVRGGGKVIISLRDDLEVAIANLTAVVEENSSSSGQDFEASIDYIDLRYGNKIFYKLQ